MSDEDKELVKMAAKACGIANYTELIECEWSDRQPARNNWGVYMGPNSYAPWNPLLDDGDALRLAVKLRLTIGHAGYTVWADHDVVGPKAREHHEDDPIAATRLAIVRIAALAGRDMP